jgi:hypothetical protein
LLGGHFFSDKAYFEGDTWRVSTKNTTQDEKKWAVTNPKDEIWTASKTPEPFYLKIPNV